MDVLPIPYVPVTVRLPMEVARQVRQVAGFSGWKMADFMRTLVCIGLAVFSLALGSQEAQEAVSTLLGGLQLLTLSRSFSLHFSKRAYALRTHSGKSALVTLNLPQAFCEAVTIYAEQMKASRNEVYAKCLLQGLLVYLKAQAIILQNSQD